LAFQVLLVGIPPGDVEQVARALPGTAVTVASGFGPAQHETDAILCTWPDSARACCALVKSHRLRVPHVL
jgi:hypothetical protein